jgi:hypothetical protein
VPPEDGALAPKHVAALYMTRISVNIRVKLVGVMNRLCHHALRVPRRYKHYANAPQWDVISTLPILLKGQHLCALPILPLHCRLLKNYKLTRILNIILFIVLVMETAFRKVSSYPSSCKSRTLISAYHMSSEIVWDGFVCWPRILGMRFRGVLCRKVMGKWRYMTNPGWTVTEGASLHSDCWVKYTKCSSNP